MGENLLSAGIKIYMLSIFAFNFTVRLQCFSFHSYICDQLYFTAAKVEKLNCKNKIKM